MSLPCTWREAFESFQNENKDAYVPGRFLEYIYQTFKDRLISELGVELSDLLYEDERVSTGLLVDLTKKNQK